MSEVQSSDRFFDKKITQYNLAPFRWNYSKKVIKSLVNLDSKEFREASCPE